MTSERRTSLWATTIAIAAVAIVVVTALALFFVRRGAPYEVGQKVDLPPALYQSSARTLIVFARNSCPACQEAKPFLAELVNGFRQTPDDRALLLSEAALAEERVFATEIAIAEGDIRSMDLRGLRVRRVPTVLLVDGRGTVLFVREGAPTPAERPEWLAALRVADARR